MSKDETFDDPYEQYIDSMSKIYKFKYEIMPKYHEIKIPYNSI